MTNKKRPLIFYVDDNEHQVTILECYSSLTPELEGVVFNSLESLCESLKTRSPDLLFLDHRLEPYTSFRETVPLIRKAGFRGRIVVMSSDHHLIRRDRPAELGITDVIDKMEMQPSSFLGTVRRLLG